MFTGAVPLGTAYKQIGQVAKEMSFLDPIEELMLRQEPTGRPVPIGAVKTLIQKHHSEAVALQRISQINGTVIKATEIDEPLAETPPKLIGFDWDRGGLVLQLDRRVTPEWIDALHRMSAHTHVFGKPPQMFSFDGDRAFVGAMEHEVQAIIDNFKTWLPNASQTLKNILQQRAKQEEASRIEKLRREREEEERRLRVLQRIKI